MIAPPDVSSYGTTKTVNAVTDLGWDPSATDPIHIPDDDGLRIEVPVGTYLIDEMWTAQELNDWALVGLGDRPDDVRFVHSQGNHHRTFNIRGGNRYLLYNFVLDMYEDWDTAMGMALKGADWHMESVQYRGWRPSEDQGTTTALNAYVDADADGYIVDYYADERTYNAPYPRNAGVLGSFPPCYGTIHLQDSTVENAGSHAFYASRIEGGIQVDNCIFRNCQNTLGRASSERSAVRDSTFIWDDTCTSVGWEQGNTGLVWEAGFQGFAGGLVENCEFICETTHAANSGVFKVDGSSGGVTLRNCDFHVGETAEGPAIQVDAPGDSHMIEGFPDAPWDVILENVTVTHMGGTHNPDKYPAAVSVSGRTVDMSGVTIHSENLDGLRLRGATLNAADGVYVDSVNGTRIDQVDTTINGTVGTKPAETDTTTDTGYAKHVTIMVTEGGGLKNYSFTADGPVSLLTDVTMGSTPAGDDGVGEVVTENDDGSYTVTGIVAGGGGDSFDVDGTITSFSHLTDPEVTVLVNGEEWVPGNEVVYDHTGSVVAGSQLPTTRYRVTTTGELVLGDQAETGTDTDMWAESVVQNGDGTYTLEGGCGKGGTDTFHFNGEVVEWEVDAPEGANLVLFVDDVTVSRTDLAGSTDNAAETGETTEPVTEPVDHLATYTVRELLEEALGRLP